jgi:hypothetical protein
MKKAVFVFILMFFFTLPAFAAAPVCLFQDVLSGPASGGENGNGIYITVTGENLGTSGTITINGTPVAQTFNWGATDVTGRFQTVGMQVASGTTSGSIVLTNSGGSCSNLSFTVRKGHIYFIGPNIDDTSPGGTSSCTTVFASGGTYTSPWGLTDNTSFADNGSNYTSYRTPYTYFRCASLGDVLVFLNGVSYAYYDGSSWHTELLLSKTGTSSSSFMTLMARPGATVTLGASGGVATTGIRYNNAEYNVISGLTAIGMGASGVGISPSPADRVVGNIIECPDCTGQAAAVHPNGTGSADPSLGGMALLGNLIYHVSDLLSGGSAKEYHDVYFSLSGFEIGWNRIYDTNAYNGIQVYRDTTTGYYNFSIHDNDIADAWGSGINLGTIDPSSGYAQVYNNIIHHVGVHIADSPGPHSCFAVKNVQSSTTAGNIQIFNNTMYDCSGDLNYANDSMSCAFDMEDATGTHGSIVTVLTNNIIYQPSYTYSYNSAVNPYVCHTSSVEATYSGSNNIWYSATTPWSTVPATVTGIGTIENPLYVSAADGLWTNYELQSSSPATGAGSASLYPTMDFAGKTRPSSPAIGALEYGSASSEVQITVSAVPSPATLEQPVTLTATVAQTGSSVPTGSINFMNGGVSLGQASLDSEGTATLVLSWLSVGSYKVIAAYSGNSNYAAGESGYVPLQVLDTTTTSLVASPNPVTAGQALVLTATVEGVGDTSPAGTVSFLNGSTPLGTAPLNASGVATLSAASLAAGTYSLTAQYTGNASFLSSNSAAVPVTVNAQATTTSLVASSNPVPAGQALALTATVQGSGSTAPAGTVSFLNGSTPLGTAPLNASGVATLSTASLAAGTYSLTAQYTGNASFLSSTSAAVPVTVNAQATVIVQSFSLNAGGSTSQTVQSGGTAVYTLGVSPAVGTTLPAINFVVSGLPAGATATFSPQTIPAGNGATNVTLSIQTSVQSAMLERNRKLGGGLVVALGILLLPFGGGIRRSGKSMLRLSYLVLFLAGAISLAGLTGCAVLNGQGAFPSASAQTYTVTVTSTAASLSQTTTVTLIVE